MAEVSTSTVEFSSDAKTIGAFLALPSRTKGLLPGVVVIHEWWGLNDHIKDIAQRCARAGYAALAPDLYSRLGHQVTTDPQEAASLMNALQSQQALRDLNAAVQCLKKQSGIDAQRMGVIGFCMGGTFALTMATHNSDIKASVPFYGKVPPLETLRYLLCPVLYHYGAQDGWVTKQEVDQLRQGLEKYGKPGEVKVYPEAGHAFFNDTRPDVHRSGDANNAWEHTLQFLAHHLR